MDTLDKILYQIKLHNLTDKAFEDNLGLKNKTVDSWKRGNSASYRRYISKIADFFGVSLDYLMREPQEEQNCMAKGSLVKKLRVQKRLRQEDIAKALNVSVTVYSGWERGVVSLTPAQLSKLASYYGVNTDELTGTAQQDFSLRERDIFEPSCKKAAIQKTLMLRCSTHPKQQDQGVYELTPDEFEYLEDIMQKILRARMQ